MQEASTMKSRKSGPGTRRAAQGRRPAAQPQAQPEPQVTGLERDGEIRLTQLLRALTGDTPAGIKPAH
jgi:hypothetical protein